MPDALRRLRLAWAFALAVATTLLAAPMPSRAIEEPAFQVVQKLGDIEVRQYAPYVVAQVQVPGSASEAGNAGFRLLLGYISGQNKGERKLTMTAPVTQAAAPAPSSVPAKLEMTAPVTQSAVPGGYLVQFVLPKDVTLASAPEPTDERVTLHEVPATRMAVIRYSGFWSDANYNAHLAELQAALRAANLQWAGEPIYSRYDPPFMPWFLRRNEIWLRLP